MGTAVLFLGIKRPGRDADYLPLTSVEVRMSGAIALLPFAVWAAITLSFFTLVSTVVTNGILRAPREQQVNSNHMTQYFLNGSDDGTHSAGSLGFWPSSVLK